MLSMPFSQGSCIHDSLPALTNALMVLPGPVGIRALVPPDSRTILNWAGGQALEYGKFGSHEERPLTQRYAWVWPLFQY